MISSYLQGGLGNQMFQIAAAIAHSKELETETCFSIDTHNLPLQGNKTNTYCENIFSKVRFWDSPNYYEFLEVFKEKNFSYEKLPDKNNLLLFGYFQSYKHFEKYKDLISHTFSETPQITETINKKYSQIDFSKTSSLHVRRGDFLKFPDTHPVLPADYYDNSIKLVTEDAPNLLVFSDDIPWCRQHLKHENISYVEDKDYLELYLMSRCKNNIIANSTFSWWAAYLNDNLNKKVIYPSTWFGPSGPKDNSDLFLKEWIKCC